MTTNSDNFVLSGSPTGFSLQIGNGVMVKPSGAVVSYSGGTITLPASSTNCVYLDEGTNTVGSSTTSPPTNSMIIGVVTTGQTGITDIKQGDLIYDRGVVQVKTSVSSFSVTVPPAKWFDAAGTVISFAGGSVTLTASGTFFLCVDLNDTPSLHAFTRPIHQGAIWIAKVTTGTAGVTGVDYMNQRVPETRLPGFKAKLAAGVATRILIIGDSLTVAAAASANYTWRDYVFNSARSADGYNVANVATVTVQNIAASGANAHYAMLACGKTVGPTENIDSNTSSPEHNDRVAFVGSYRQLNSAGVSFYRCQDSPYLANAADLVIIALGANPRTYELLMLENAIRQFQAAGSEVLYLAENHRTDFATLADTTSSVLALVEATGCALADWWSYTKEANDLLGASTYADEVHQNTSGQPYIAAAVKSVLNSFRQTGIRQAPASRTVNLPTTASQALSNTRLRAYFAYSQYSGTGTLVAVNDSTLAPSVAIAGRSSTVATYELDPGEHVITTFPYCTFGCDLVLDPASGETYTVEILTDSAGKVLFGTSGIMGAAFEITGASVPFAMYCPIDASNISQSTTTVFSDAHTYVTPLGLRVRCAASSTHKLKLQGVVYYGPETVEIPLSRFETYNSSAVATTWSREEAPFQKGHFTPYTDTVGDYVIIPFEGDGIAVGLAAGSYAGKVDVWLDGVKVITAKDLYSGGTANLVYNLIVMAQNSTPSYNYNAGNARHWLKIAAVTANASATASTTNYRKLHLYGAQALLTSW